MKVSIIVPCKNRLHHLKRTLPKMKMQSHRCEVIVVDMNCPVNTHEWTKRQDVIGVKVDCAADHWNLSESRNIGYLHSSGEVLVFLDADSVINTRFVEKTLELVSHCTFASGSTAENGTEFNACGCLMVRREHFEHVKGYNEELKGWGFEDFDIHHRLMEQLHLERREFDRNLIKSIPHNNKMRNQYHSHEPIHDSNKRNHLVAKIRFKGLE